MAFKRANFTSMKTTQQKYFATEYKFSRKTNFADNSDVYVIPLGLETGYYETPCHEVKPHKIDGQTIGFGGSPYPAFIKCKGIDEEGNRVESLCCELAAKERERLPESDDIGKRIISSQKSRIHLPVLILNNAFDDDTLAYPVTRVGILKDLKSEKGLNFAYLEMSKFTFQQEIISAYGKQLKENGDLDYDMDENSDDFLEAVRERLCNTIIKVHGYKKPGFSAAMREYMFIPFNDPKVARESGDEERKYIINYRKSPRIVEQINDFLTLFDVEVDNLVRDWNEKDLMEYYRSAVGLNIKGEAPVKEAKTLIKEKVEVLPEKEHPFADDFVDDIEIEEPKAKKATPAKTKTKAFADDDFVEDDIIETDNKPKELTDEDKAMLDDLDDDLDKAIKAEVSPATSTDLDDFEYDTEDDFFAEESEEYDA